MNEGRNVREKRLLIIANLYHASPRIPRLAKHISSLGWKITIITPRIIAGSNTIFNAPPEDLEKAGIRIIEAGDDARHEVQSDARKGSIVKRSAKKFAARIDSGSNGRMMNLMKRYYWRFYLTINFPDIERKWKEPALKAAKNLLEKEKYDLILSSSSPITTHVIASELKKTYNIPWIGEYRDLWTLNFNYQLGSIMRRFDRRLESKTMRNADALVTVSDAWVASLREMFPLKPAYNVPNGYDLEESPQNVPVTQTFTITYTGQYYLEKQNPQILFDSLNELINEEKINRSRLEVRFFGPRDDDFQRYIERLGLADVIKQFGVVSRNESLMRQRESQILWFMNWEDPKQTWASSLKLVEYLSAGRPILLTGGAGDNVIATMIRQTNTGDYAPSKSEIKSKLREHYEAYLKNGRVPFAGLRDEIEKYDVKNIAKNYAHIMDKVIGFKG